MRSLLKRVLARLVRCASRSGTNGPSAARELTAWALAHVDERRRVATAHGGFTIRVSNPLERWRADTLLSKEPETIAWLDATIGADSVFYDAGANIGLYSLYACYLNSSVRAVCFEPEALNFARLNLNLHDNGLSGRALAFPIGLGAEDAVFVFRLSALEAGRALHGDRFVKQGAEAHRQGMAVLPLDELRRRAGDLLAPPTHLKVDVDGPELEVLAGAGATLALPSLVHVLVEAAADQQQAVLSILDGHGFDLVARGAEAADGTNLIFRRR